MKYLLLAEGIKMADGHQENTQNTTIPETNEGDSNDVEEADEVLDIRWFIYLFIFHLFLLLKWNETV